MTGWPRGRSRDGGIDEIPLPAVPGRLWLCGHRVVGPDPEAALARVGGTGLICLCERHELADRYPDYVDWLDRADPQRGHWFPVPDLGVRPLADHLGLVDHTVDRLRAGAVLIAHCAAGIGRSGTLAAAILVALGLDERAALTTVADSRPTAGPEVGAQAELITSLVGHYRSSDPPTGP